MEEKERALHRNDMAELYIATRSDSNTARFSCIRTRRGGRNAQLIELIRAKSGSRYFLLMHAIRHSAFRWRGMLEFATRLARTGRNQREAAKRVADAISNARNSVNRVAWMALRFVAITASTPILS